MKSPAPLSLAEQVVVVELAYWRQYAYCHPCQEDVRTWQRRQGLFKLLDRPLGESFERHVLERNGFSLHRFMAIHLSPEAWAYWFAQGGVHFCFRR
ncbi:hypothetical protein GCM10027346_42850 [Hymenobacter seoulensis]